MSTIRDEARELFATTLDWLADDFAFAFMNDGYLFDGAHTRLDDLAGGDIEDTIAITSKTATDGVLFADSPPDHTFPTPAVIIIGGWLYHDTGVAATSELLAWYDKRSSGLDIRYTVPAEATKIRWPADRFGQGFITL